MQSLFAPPCHRVADARKEKTMKANKSILALLLALTLLLGWTPVAWAKQQTISIRVLPEVDEDFDILYNGAKLKVEEGDGSEYDLVQIEIDSGDEKLTLQLKYKKKYWSSEGGVTVGTVNNYGWKVGEFNHYGSTEDGDWICNITIEKNDNFSGYPGLQNICEINAFYVEMVPPSATLTYDDGVEDESVSGMPEPASEQVKLPGSADDSTPTGNFTAAAAPTRSGYSFQGWRASWNNELYGAGQKVTVTALPKEKLTLTAEWEKQNTTAIPGKPVEGGDSGSGDSTQSYYYIHADCSSGGSVSPSGYTRVSKNGSLTVSFAPKSGYSILAVYVDGVKTGTADGQYTFSNVTADHKIYVQFEKTSEGYDDVPKTGDEAPLAAAAGLGLLALLGLGCLLASRRRAMQR